MGFDTETGVEDTIFDSLHNIIRPLITYDGSRVVWSCGESNEVFIINWDGTGRRKLGDGIAGTLWYDEANEREYMYYAKDCELYRSYVDTAYAIYRRNLDDPSDTRKLLDPEEKGYGRCQPHFMGTTSDGEMIGMLIGWPNIRVYNAGDGYDGVTSAGCWVSMAYDTTDRLVNFNPDHNGVVVKSLRSTDDLWLCPSDGSGGHTECGVDHPKMATYHPRYLCYIDEPDDGEGTGPGLVHVAKVNTDITSIETDVQVTVGDPFPDYGRDGWPDAWIKAIAKTGMIKLESPAEGDVWEEGSEQDVTWTSQADFSHVLVHLSIDDGQSWEQIAYGANTGSLQITVPAIGFTNPTSLIKIQNAFDPEMADTSEYFTIGTGTTPPKPSINISAPHGSTTWEQGSAGAIAWSAEEIDSVTLMLTSDSGATWQALDTVDAALGTFSYTVPQNMESAGCRVVVAEFEGGVSDTSDGFFTITGQPAALSIAIVSPATGVKLPAGDSVNVEWTHTGTITSFDIGLSSDIAGSWTSPATGITGDRVRVLVPGELDSAKCCVKVAAADGSAADTVCFTAVDTSSNDTGGSAQPPAIAIIAPVAGDTWVWNTQATIEWEAPDSIDKVRISLSFDGGSTWHLSTRSDNDGAYPVGITGDLRVLSETCVLRMTAHQLGAAEFFSDTFAIDSIALQPASARPSRRIPKETRLRSVAPLADGRLELSLALAVPGAVELTLYETSGRVAARHSAAGLPAGYHDLQWQPRAHDGTPPTGGYVLRMRTGSLVVCRAIVVLR